MQKNNVNKAKATKGTKAPVKATKGARGKANAKAKQVGKTVAKATRNLLVGSRVLPVNVTIKTDKNSGKLSGVYLSKRGNKKYQIQRFDGGTLLADGTYIPNPNRKTLSTRFMVFDVTSGKPRYIETVKGFNNALKKYA